MALSKPRDKTKREILAHSGNQCAFPSCARRIFDKGVMQGQLSHIKGRKPGSPRYDPSQSDEDRHSASNLMVMCDEHGTLVDDPANISTYPVSVLKHMKAEHEASIEGNADRNWILPPNSITGGALLNTTVYYWIDRNGIPQVYSDEQLAKINALLHLSIDFSNLSTLMQTLGTIDEPIVQSLMQQSYAQVGKDQDNLYAYIAQLMAIAPEITLGEFLRFIVKGGDATSLIHLGAKRLRDIVEGREPSFWRHKKPGR